MCVCVRGGGGEGEREEESIEGELFGNRKEISEKVKSNGKVVAVGLQTSYNDILL